MLNVLRKWQTHITGAPHMQRCKANARSRWCVSSSLLFTWKTLLGLNIAILKTTTTTTKSVLICITNNFLSCTLQLSGFFSPTSHSVDLHAHPTSILLFPPFVSFSITPLICYHIHKCPPIFSLHSFLGFNESYTDSLATFTKIRNAPITVK